MGKSNKGKKKGSNKGKKGPAAAPAAAKPKAAPLPSGPCLHYWAGVKSRAHYIQFVAKFFGKELHAKGDQPYPGTPEWDSPDLVKSALGQLPVLTDGEIKVGQTIAIINYLVKKYGIDDNASLAEAAKSQEVIYMCGSIHDSLGKAQYSPDRTAAMDEYLTGVKGLPKELAVIESYISPSGWLGADPTAGDACLAALVEILLTLDASVMEKFPKMKAVYEKVLANADVKAFSDSTPYPYFKRKSDPVPASYACLCGGNKFAVSGKPVASVYCHCKQCQIHAGAEAMQLCIVKPDQVSFSAECLNKYESTKGVFRNSCLKCGSFVYKILGDGNYVVSTSALVYGDEETKKAFAPACHIFMEGKYQDYNDELPKFQQWPN